MTDFLKNIVKEVGNEYASLVIDGVDAGDVDSFIDTGSYIFNALLSGSIYGGLPQNKITALAGESATGKTYFLMGIVKNFLDKLSIIKIFKSSLSRDNCSVRLKLPVPITEPLSKSAIIGIISTIKPLSRRTSYFFI